jgi:predicted DNA-binding protein YlxM (UPF0122 family)
MDNNTVIKLLADYRSYKFALMNLGGEQESRYTNRNVYAERKPLHISNYNTWYDRERYTRVVGLLESAVDFVLSDEQRSIIRDKYMERNRLNLGEIADKLHKDRKTVSTQHKKAINSLCKALLPISQDYMEINNLDHMFEDLKPSA